MPFLFSEAAQRRAIISSLTHIAYELNLRASVQLWNGEVIPLGEEPNPKLMIKIDKPGVIGALIRRPTPESLLRLYAVGAIDFEGGNLIEFREALRMTGSSRQRLKGLDKSLLIRNAIPFLFSKAPATKLKKEFADDAIGRVESKRNNKDYIQFHYDVGNEFYKLFLDEEMQYSCGYFQQANNTLEQAQIDKLDMICRKLRLQPGDSMLDIGCGWGGLICHAARNYGVTAHGVTLSQEQHDFAAAKIKRLGLADRVKVEIRDYADLDGQYDKISSIGMFEHIGIANYAKYFKKVQSLLGDEGIFINHAIASASKRTKRKSRYIRPERRLLLKYIFPGSELSSVGFTTNAMEHEGFEVHDVESWREHYGLTCRAWCERLTDRKDEAIRMVGLERYRLWVAYLAGASCGFADGGIKIYQVVASRRRKGSSPVPLTRADLYAEQVPVTS